MEHSFRVLIAAIVAALFVTTPAPAQDSAQPSTQARGPEFEVCVVATIHAPWQFRWQGISPAHVRAALQQLEPDVLGVESNPEWFARGVFHEVTYEAQGVAIPFAKQRGIPVYGVDWMDVPAWDRRAADHQRSRIRRILEMAKKRWLPTQMFGEQSPTYLAANSDLKRFFFKTDMGFDHVNQVRDDKYATQWTKGDTAAEQFGGHRNQQIVKRCLEVMARHRGKRLVVVIGAGHKAVLDILFARQPGVKVLRLGKDIAAPTSAEVTAAQTTEDLVVMLGHNLDGERSCFHAELMDTDRVQKQITSLRAAKGFESHADYFAARLALLRGDARAAARFLTEIGDQEPRAKLYPFPMQHWRMVYDFDQAVRVAKAELALEMDQPEAAAKHLKGLAGEIQVPVLPKSVFESGPLLTEVPTSAKEWAPNGRALKLVDTALFLAAEQTATPKVGMAALTHELRIREKGPLRIEFSVRSRNRGRGAIEIYERNTADGHMIKLGSKSFTMGPRWSAIATDFQVRDTDKPIWIFVYLDAQVGTRYGVEKMKIRKAPATDIPADWIPRMLAKQFVRTLLSN